jgi:hypothetical protein
MKSNVLAAPKAPAISPRAAALLSVCFKLHAPTTTTIVHTLSSRTHANTLKSLLTPKSAGCLCTHIRNPLLLVVGNAPVAHTHSRCTLIHTRQNARRDLLHRHLLCPHCLCALRTRCASHGHFQAAWPLAYIALGYSTNNASGHDSICRPAL